MPPRVCAWPRKSIVPVVRGVQVLMSAGGPNYCAPEEELRVGGWALVATKRGEGLIWKSGWVKEEVVVGWVVETT